MITTGAQIDKVVAVWLIGWLIGAAGSPPVLTCHPHSAHLANMSVSSLLDTAGRRNLRLEHSTVITAVRRSIALHVFYPIDLVFND